MQTTPSLEDQRCAKSYTLQAERHTVPECSASGARPPFRPDPTSILYTCDSCVRHVAPLASTHDLFSDARSRVAQPYIVASDQAHPKRFRKGGERMLSLGKWMEGKMAFEAS